MDVDDLSEPEDENITLVAQCKEQMEIPAPKVRAITGRRTESGVRMVPQTVLSFVPGPMFEANYFDLGMDRRSVAGNPRTRKPPP